MHAARASQPNAAAAGARTVAPRTCARFVPFAAASHGAPAGRLQDDLQRAAAQLDRRTLLGAAAGMAAAAAWQPPASAVQGLTAGRIPGVTGPDPDGYMTYTRPEGKSGGRGGSGRQASGCPGGSSPRAPPPRCMTHQAAAERQPPLARAAQLPAGGAPRQPRSACCFAPAGGHGVGWTEIQRYSVRGRSGGRRQRCGCRPPGSWAPRRQHASQPSIVPQPAPPLHHPHALCLPLDAVQGAAVVGGDPRQHRGPGVRPPAAAPAATYGLRPPAPAAAC
jgi:hypothetical protein